MRNLLPVIVCLAALGSFPQRVVAQAPAAASAAATSANQENARLVSAAQAKFAYALIKKLAAANGAATDVTVSPASAASVFAVIAQGADAAMRDAVVKTFQFEKAETEKALALLQEARAAFAQEKSDVLRSADRIVFAPGAEPSPVVRAGLEKLGVAFSADDLTKPESVAKINEWVKETTRGKISEILGGPLDRPSFVALDALHFKDRWKTPFDRELTEPTPFHGADGKREQVEMMRSTASQRAFRAERGFLAVDLPFASERFSLVVVTTTEKPARLAEFAPVADWLLGERFSLRRGDLALPRFAVEGRNELLPALDALGLDKGRRSPTALSGFAPGTALSQVVQRVVMEVDEDGAEAAAATAATTTRALAPDDALHMVVDKPFLFALRDRASGMILAAGYVGKAPKGKG